MIGSSHHFVSGFGVNDFGLFVASLQQVVLPLLREGEVLVEQRWCGGESYRTR
jgi:hypothetical protein